MSGGKVRGEICMCYMIYSYMWHDSFIQVSLVESFEEKFNGNYDPALLYGQVSVYVCSVHVCESSVLVCERVAVLVCERVAVRVESRC